MIPHPTPPHPESQNLLAPRFEGVRVNTLYLNVCSVSIFPDWIVFPFMMSKLFHCQQRGV